MKVILSVVTFFFFILLVLYVTDNLHDTCYFVNLRPGYCKNNIILTTDSVNFTKEKTKEQCFMHAKNSKVCFSGTELLDIAFIPSIGNCLCLAKKCQFIIDSRYVHYRVICPTPAQLLYAKISF